MGVECVGEIVAILVLSLLPITAWNHITNPLFRNLFKLYALSLLNPTGGLILSTRYPSGYVHHDCRIFYFVPQKYKLNWILTLKRHAVWLFPGLNNHLGQIIKLRWHKGGGIFRIKALYSDFSPFPGIEINGFARLWSYFRRQAIAELFKLF